MVRRRGEPAAAFGSLRLGQSVLRTEALCESLGGRAPSLLFRQDVRIQNPLGKESKRS